MLFTVLYTAVKQKQNKNSKTTIRGYLEGFSSLRFIPRFFKLIWQTSPVLFASNALVRLIKAFLPIVILWVGKEIIDEVILQVAADTKTMSRLWWLIGVEFALALVSDISNRFINLTDGLLGDLYGNKSSIELIQKTAKMDLADLEDSEFYDKLERARRQTTNRVGLMSNVLSQVQDLITVASLMAALIYFEPWLIVLLVVSIIPAFLNELKFSKTSYSLMKSWTPERRELDYLRMIGASDVTAKEIKLFGLADYISTNFSTLAHKYYEANKKISIGRSLWGSLFHLVGDIAYYGAYVFIILRVVAGVITVGQLTFLAGSFNRLRNKLQTIFFRFSKITESAMYLQDYFDFIDLEPTELLATDPLPLPDELTTGFTFENVIFSYPGSDKKVLDGLSFTLHQGEKLALVGENGAGKTTLVKLLLRLYEPTSGVIKMDCINIQRYDREAYQQFFGAIFQDFVKYYLDARTNIAVGNIAEIKNTALIQKAADQSLAKEVIESLPDGYDQVLGRRFKKGAELSGGQWQKVALARAYMANSKVIILDEPTSALDARAEYEAFQRFIALTMDRTSIIISHRFSTVRMADRILVLKNGGVLEIGTHEELMHNQGLYSELFDLQAEGYK